jgi:hypothetical protein
MADSIEDALFCVACKEEFPVSAEPAGWAMGQLRPLAKAPQRLRDRHWTERGRAYLCGNCYFDYMDGVS